LAYRSSGRSAPSPWRNPALGMLLRLGPSIVPITLILGGQRLRMPSAAAVQPGSSARGRVTAGSVPGALECACWAGRTCEARLYIRFSCAAQAKLAKGTVGSVPLAYEPRAQFRLSPFYVSAPNALWPLTPAGLRPAPFAAPKVCRPASFAAPKAHRPAPFAALRSHQPGRFEPRKAFRCGFGAARRGGGVRGTAAGVSGSVRCFYCAQGRRIGAPGSVVAAHSRRPSACSVRGSERVSACFVRGAESASAGSVRGSEIASTWTVRAAEGVSVRIRSRAPGCRPSWNDGRNQRTSALHRGFRWGTTRRDEAVRS
jgi:hypothetical protein